MPRTPEQIAAEAFKLRPRTAQISVWLDDSGSLHAVAPDHANGGVVPIEDPWLTTPEAVASFKKIWAALLTEDSLAEQTKQRERLVRYFDCPLTDSRCAEAGCSLTRCVRREREDNAFRRHHEEKARAARGGSRQSRHENAAADALALARDIASIKL